MTLSYSYQNCSDLNDAMALTEYNNYLNTPTEESRQRLDAYLMSRDGRDCSVMMRIQENKERRLCLLR